MMSPEGIRREKGEYQKPLHQPLPLVELIPDDLRAEGGLDMASWIRAWYHREHEEEKNLRGNL